MSQQHLVHACAPGDEEVEDLGGDDVVPVGVHSVVQGVDPGVVQSDVYGGQSG